MTDIAAHIRVFAQDPDDDFVVKREAAIKDLSSKYIKGSKGVGAYVRSANEIALALETRRALSQEFVSDIEAALKKESISFVAEGHDLEIKVCAALAAIQAIESSKPSSGTLTAGDVFAVCLWSALSFQKPLSETKFENIRAELMSKARTLIENSASESRRRKEVKQFDCPAPKEATPPAIKESVDIAAKLIIDALRTNAVLDREEIDFLWWVLGDWSGALSQRYSAPTNREAAALAAGLEAGMMLRRMPAEAHKQLVLRLVTDDGQYTMPELFNVLQPVIPALASSVPDNEVVLRCPQVFPLISALKVGKTDNSPKTKIKRPMCEWSARALLEAAIVRLTEHPGGVAV